MSDPSPRPSVIQGLAGTLGLSLAAALTTGLLFGLTDAVIAVARGHAPRGAIGILGCFAAAVMAYVAVHAVVLVSSGLALHPFLKVRPQVARLRVLLAAGLSAGLFLEIYWWTRPFVFYGESSISVKRLIAAGVQALIALLLGWVLSGFLVRLSRGAQRALRGVALLCVAGGLVFVFTERAKVAERGTLNERNRDLPNVLFIVVDALRADVLGCYGNERVKTPVIDALAERGVLFENYQVQAPYTWTSFGSMLTGKYPRRHGLTAQKPGVRMVREHVTLPWHFKTAKGVDGRQMEPNDWTGGAFMTGALSHGSGLDRGFDVYAEAMMGHDVVETESRWSVFRSELLLWLFKSKLEQRIDSSLVVSLARRWIRANSDRRWVALVHLYSTHTPYDPPREFREMYLDPEYGGPLEAFYADYRYRIEAGEYDPTPEDVEQIRNLYYAGVTQADAMIGELLGELEELGILEDTLIVVTSDHGEDLGERERCWEHNHMWQTNLWAPLVIAGPGLPSDGRRIPQLTESVDLLPTFCELFGLELPAADEKDPYSLVDGRSMLPLLAAGAEELAHKPYAFAENHFYLSIQDLEHKLIVERDIVAKGEADALFSSEEGRHVPVRFFDLRTDPEEWRNLAVPDQSAAQEARMREMFADLVRWSESMPTPTAESYSSSRDQERQNLLNDLGYAEGFDEEDDEEDDE